MQENKQESVVSLMMLEKRLIPVVVLNKEEHALPLAETLLAAGLDVIEITLRTQAALSGIQKIRKSLPEMKVGVGTVIDPEAIPQLADLGAEFIVSPGINPKVISASQKAGLTIYPGVATPTDIETARALGVDVLKFFPAEPLGSVTMLKALIAPYGHTGIKFIPTGGIDASKAAAYAPLDAVAAIGGSWFVKAELMETGKWDEIETLTRQAIEIMDTT